MITCRKNSTGKSISDGNRALARAAAKLLSQYGPFSRYLYSSTENPKCTTPHSATTIAFVNATAANVPRSSLLPKLIGIGRSFHGMSFWSSRQSGFGQLYASMIVFNLPAAVAAPSERAPTELDSTFFAVVSTSSLFEPFTAIDTEFEALLNSAPDVVAARRATSVSVSRAVVT